MHVNLLKVKLKIELLGFGVLISQDNNIIQPCLE